MTKEKVTQAYENIKSIEKLLDEAETLFNEIPDRIRHAILKYHNTDSSVNYCLRWGRQAATEVRDDWHDVVSKLQTEEADPK